MTKKRRLKADDWVELGLAELARHGPDAIKLEAICTAAGLTRGSFYHHFNDHLDFLKSVVTAWQNQSTVDVIQGINSAASTEEIASNLTTAALQIDYRLELGIRELGRRLPEIADIVRETDLTRIATLTKIYAERFGIDEPIAEDFAFIEYAAFSGMILLNPDMDKGKQHRLAAQYDSLVERALSTGI